MGGGGLVINYSAHVGSLFLWRIYCATAVHHTPQDALPNKSGGGYKADVSKVYLRIKRPCFS